MLSKTFLILSLLIAIVNASLNSTLISRDFQFNDIDERDGTNVALGGSTTNLYFVQEEVKAEYIAVWQAGVSCKYYGYDISKGVAIIRYYPLNTCVFANGGFALYQSSESRLEKQFYDNVYCTGNPTSIGTAETLNSCSATATQYYTTTTTRLVRSSVKPTNAIENPLSSFDQSVLKWLLAGSFHKAVAQLPSAAHSYANFTGWSGTQTVRVYKDITDNRNQVVAVDYSPDYMNDNVQIAPCSGDGCKASYWVDWTDNTDKFAAQYNGYSSITYLASDSSRTYALECYYAYNFAAPFVITFPTITATNYVTVSKDIKATETVMSTYFKTVYVSTVTETYKTTFTGYVLTNAYSTKLHTSTVYSQVATTTKVSATETITKIASLPVLELISVESSTVISIEGTSVTESISIDEIITIFETATTTEQTSAVTFTSATNLHTVNVTSTTETVLTENVTGIASFFTTEVLNEFTTEFLTYITSVSTDVFTASADVTDTIVDTVVTTSTIVPTATFETTVEELTVINTSTTSLHTVETTSSTDTVLSTSETATLSYSITEVLNEVETHYLSYLTNVITDVAHSTSLVTSTSYRPVSTTVVLVSTAVVEGKETEVDVTQSSTTRFTTETKVVSENAIETEHATSVVNKFQTDIIYSTATETVDAGGGGLGTPAITGIAVAAGLSVASGLAAGAFYYFKSGNVITNTADMANSFTNAPSTFNPTYVPNHENTFFNPVFETQSI